MLFKVIKIPFMNNEMYKQVYRNMEILLTMEQKMKLSSIRKKKSI